MTGFGRASVEADGKRITVEIKSLNSKQLDLAVRLPQPLREAEPELRALVAQKLQRGKADLTVTLEQLSAAATSQINIPVMRAYKEQIQAMAAELGIAEPQDWYSVLLRLPDAMRTDTAEQTERPVLDALMHTAALAVDALMLHRRVEGQRLEEFFAARVSRIGELLAQVPRYEKERVEKIRARIVDALEQLPGVEYDKGRFEQEMIFYIEKLDINEEKQRLAQHLRYFLETMAAPEAGQGKKLGFIAQEMGREINTLGSKSNHAEMQILVVKMKDELEQIKEQVLNVM